MASGTVDARNVPHAVIVYNKELGCIMEIIHRLLKYRKGEHYCTYKGRVYQLQENKFGDYCIEY